MSLERATLRLGSKVWFDQQAQEVVALNSITVTLRSQRTAEQTVVAIAELLTAEGFSTTANGKGEDTSPESLGRAFAGVVPKAQEKAAMEMLKHLLEAKTGYQSGTDEDALQGEPKPQYDPASTNLSQRIAAKAKELNMSERVLWNYKADHERYGLYGLIDRRAVRLADVGPSPEVTAAISRVVRKLHDKSNQTLERILALVKKEIRDAENLSDDFEMPSDSTLRRYLLDREDGRQLMKSAKGRRNAANRPKHAYTRFHATRPGEVVLIDSTPLDAFVLDPNTLKPFRVTLTIAIDLYTRSLVGWRFSPTDKAIDAALLLADIISPKRSREFFGGAATKPFVGIPQSIVTRLQADEEENERLGRLVPIPFLHPESLLIDQGRVYISQTFLMAAAQLGINVMLARPYTPTDKAHVERMFKTIRESFVLALPGYTGPNVEARGKKPEDDAFYFVHEIDEYFREWVATYWQVRIHDGLFLPAAPTLELTPNQMLSEGIARAGFMHVLPDKNMRYQLMPLVRRMIHHYGVDVGSLRYDSADLDPFRNEPPPYPNSDDKKWPFRQDPRDKSVLFFFDPDTKEWAEIPWTGANGKHRPFDDKTLQLAKDIAFQRINEAPTREDIKRVLNEILDRMGNVAPRTHAERRRLRDAIEQERVRQERERRKALKSGGDVGDEGAATAPAPAPQQVSVDWSVPAIPRHLEVYSGDMDEDVDPSEDAPAGSAASSAERGSNTAVKPVDEAFEDADDDLVF